MRNKDIQYLVGDFETTVYDGQTHTEVWASALVPLYSEDVKIFHSINETWDYITSLEKHLIIYYHNLKFDGTFWLDFFLIQLGYKQASKQLDENGLIYEWKKEKEMENNTFKYVISDMGQWYSIIIKVKGHIIELRDSLKLLPFSVKKIGKSFNTKHKKLDMEYTGFRYAGCTITDEEKEYIKNDVLVVKEALEIMFNEGHTKLTIGSCCLEEFKKTLLQANDDYNLFFPDLYKIEIPEETYGSPTAGDYIRKSYKGGWCYLVEEKAEKLYKNGVTADVNSLYPSMMSSESGNYYPLGRPVFWSGNFIPEEATKFNRYYFIRIKTRFKIKDNMLPFIQIKGSPFYNPTQSLKTSDFYDPRDKIYRRFLINKDGTKFESNVTLTLTMTDYILFREHYNVYDFQILDGCWFCTDIGIFDKYIDKYKKIKLESKGAMRELAKLFLNNLYGKMASSKCSSFKYAIERDDKSVGFITVEEYNKKPGYIAVGSAITSYARNFTIRAAQKNYYGPNKAGFIYADTDSIHCDLSPNQIKGITVHDKNFCCWKLESGWDTGWFVRQKTYIEHCVTADGEPLEKPYYSVRCAGMPARCKDLFIASVLGYEPKPEDNFTDEELEFISEKRKITDFKRGLCVPSKLMPKRIQGGTLLVPTTYQMR